jgi:hypothetical protein
MTAGRRALTESEEAWRYAPDRGNHFSTAMTDRAKIARNWRPIRFVGHDKTADNLDAIHLDAIHLGSARSIPEVQQELAEACGILSFSQQRAFGPCSPGCTVVQAKQRFSALQALWQSAQLSAERSKPR